jgi:hypothetical protein
MNRDVDMPEPSGEWVVQFVNEIDDTATVRVIAASHDDAIQGCRRIIEEQRPGPQWRPYAARRVTGIVHLTVP